VCICKQNLENFYVNAYSLRDKSHKQAFNIKISGEYVKMNLVEQTDNGKYLALAYQNMGRFWIKIINQKG
jgi:hypothetical protein